MRWVKRLSILGLVGALLVASALAYVLFGKYKSAYSETLAIRLDPIGASEAEPIVFSDGRPTAVVFGDSRARQWKLPELLGWQMVSNGIVGQTTAQARLRFPEALSSVPQVVVMQMGINDLKAIGVFPARRTEIVEAVKANFSAMVDQARASKATVVITSIMPIGKVGLTRKLVWSDEIEAARRETNAWLAKLAESATANTPGVSFLDLEPLLAVNHTLDPAIARDTLHLTEAGYRRLDKALIDAIKSNGAIWFKL
jgi:lysophospholipase L1-like esterase